MNLFEKFEEVLSSDILKSFGKLYNEHSGDHEKAINGILYTMIAGLIRRSNSAMSTNMMISQIKKNYTENIKNHDFAKNGNSEKDILEMINLGQSGISQIFPAFKSPLLSLISSYAGTGKQQTIGFTGYITTYIVQKLGKMLFEEKMSSDDLIYYLQQHREVLFDQAPKELLDKMIPALGLQEISTMRVAQPKKVTKQSVSHSKVEEGEVVENQETTESSYQNLQNSNRWIFLAIALCILGVLSYVVFQNRDELFGTSSDEIVAEAVAEEPTEIVDSVMKDSTSNVVVMPISEFENSNNPLEKIYDLPMFSFSPGQVDLSSTQLADAKPLVDLMKANRSIQIQILGNNDGLEDNIALKRAFSLKRYLLDQGIDNIRIDATNFDSKVNNLQLKVISR